MSKVQLNSWMEPEWVVEVRGAQKAMGLPLGLFLYRAVLDWQSRLEEEVGGVGRLADRFAELESVVGIVEDRLSRMERDLREVRGLRGRV